MQMSIVLVLAACVMPGDAFIAQGAAHVLRAGRGSALSALRCQASPHPQLDMSRRSALVVGAGLLGQVLVGKASDAVAEGRIPQVPDDGRERNVVLTGANSGIGKDAAIKMATGGYNVYIAARTLAKAQVSLKIITHNKGETDLVESWRC